MAVKRGLRQRVALGIAVLSLLIVSAHSVALYLITEDQEETRIDEVVLAEMESLLARHRENPAAAALRSRNLASYVVRGPGEREGLPVYLRDLPVGMHEVYNADREWHVAVRAVGDARFYVAYDVAYHEERLKEFRWLLVFGLMITGVAAIALGYALAGLLTRPVTDLAQRVSRLEAGPAVPLAERYAEEEVRRLGQAFDDYSARMAQFIAREQEFTANVSHELRTPLTAIRTGCELLLADAGISAEAHRRIERIQRGAEQMRDLIESLLLLARSRQSREAEQIGLRECVDDAAESLHEMATAQAVELRNEIAPDAGMRADRAALQVVLANLLRNAVANTQAGRVTVRMRDDALEIEDTGCGIAADDLPHVFDRFYRGRKSPPHAGHGLGLAIVRQICDQHGWQLALASEPDRGTRATLRLSGQPGSSPKEVRPSAAPRLDDKLTLT